MQQLPLDVWRLILSHLEPGRVARLSRLCRDWWHAVGGGRHARIHLNHVWWRLDGSGVEPPQQRRATRWLRRSWPTHHRLTLNVTGDLDIPLDGMEQNENLRSLTVRALNMGDSMRSMQLWNRFLHHLLACAPRLEHLEIRLVGIVHHSVCPCGPGLPRPPAPPAALMIRTLHLHVPSVDLGTDWADFLVDHLRKGTLETFRCHARSMAPTDCDRLVQTAASATSCIALRGFTLHLRYLFRATTEQYRETPLRMLRTLLAAPRLTELSLPRGWCTSLRPLRPTLFDASAFEMGPDGVGRLTLPGRLVDAWTARTAVGLRRLELVLTGLSGECRPWLLAAVKAQLTGDAHTRITILQS